MLKEILKKTIQYLFSNKTSSIELIRNINIDTQNQSQPKVLISYLCSLFDIDFQKGTDRTYHYEINEIIKIFTKKGYCIDIVNCLAISKISQIQNTKYNVIFGFGEVFYQMARLQPQADSILYMTENHPDISKKEENKRKQYYYERHKKHVKYTRSGIFYTSEQFSQKYNHLITLSDIEPLKNDYKQIYTICPTGLVNSNFIFTEKNHNKTKKSYLWFGSSGAIHKGLDLLVDIFKEKKDFDLHICGLNQNEQQFLKIPIQENIHIYGKVNVYTPLYLNIINKCSFVILPSCSEALSTSITTCMLHGLIPIVIKDTGFNILGSNAIFLTNYRIEYLEHELEKFSSYNNSHLETLRRNSYKFARANFTISSYAKQFNYIINSILK